MQLLQALLLLCSVTAMPRVRLPSIAYGQMLLAALSCHHELCSALLGYVCICMLILLNSYQVKRRLPMPLCMMGTCAQILLACARTSSLAHSTSWLHTVAITAVMRLCAVMQADLMVLRRLICANLDLAGANICTCCVPRCCIFRGWLASKCVWS